MPAYKSIFDATPDGILAVDDGGVILLANPAAEAMFGYQPGTLAGQAIEALVPKAVAKQHADYRAHYCRAPSNRPMGVSDNLQGRRRNGELFHVDIMLSPVELEVGRATLCIVRDATKRKIMERELHIANAVFQTTQEAIVVTDENCMIVAINPAFEKVTEYAEHEVLGRPINLLRSGKHDRDFYRQMWQSIHETGEWEGEIWNRRKSGEIYQEWLSISTVRDHSGKPIQFVGVSADMTRMNHAETPIEHLAHHDALTGLSNRLLFQSRIKKTLEHAHRSKQGFAILFLDLDGFKLVNDELGHHVGDQLLVQVAHRLNDNIRETDTLARFGGDEFVIVLEDASHQDVETIAQSLVDEIGKAFDLGEFGQVNVGLSVGWSLYPDHASDIPTLMKLADAALYQAKRTGRGKWVAHSQS